MTAAALGFAALAGLVAIAVGRTLSRSVAAVAVALGALAAAFASVGIGVLGWLPATLAVAVLAVIQLLGWMLVDVDRDHLPPTDGATRLARGLAFALLAGGLVLLAGALDGAPDGVRVGDPVVEAGAALAASRTALDPADLGRALFGESRELVMLCGLVVAAALLAAMTTLRDDGEVR